MASAGLVEQYIIIVIATLLFTVLALNEIEQNPKSIILQYFAGALWLLSGFAHLIAGDTTSTLTYAVSYLFYGFATVFIIAGFWNSINLVNGKRKPQL